MLSAKVEVKYQDDSVLYHSLYYYHENEPTKKHSKMGGKLTKCKTKQTKKEGLGFSCLALVTNDDGYFVRYE